MPERLQAEPLLADLDNHLLAIARYSQAACLGHGPVFYQPALDGAFAAHICQMPTIYRGHLVAQSKPAERSG